jgi:uncharacterized membrane protein (DUF106 family)
LIPPSGALANPYIGSSIGDAVAEDSSSSEDSDSEEFPESEEPVETPEATETTEPAPAPKPLFSRPSLTRFVMIFLGLLAIYALISPEVGVGFASIANAILFPAFGFGGALPVVTILLAGMLTTSVSSLIRDHYTNWVKMARSQKVMSAWRREQMDAMRKGQSTKLEKLKEFQQTIQKDQMEMMTTPYKSMAWTMFLFIVIFTWLRLFVDVVLQGLGNQWIAVPWSSHVYLNSFWVLFPAWVLLYSLLAIPFGQIITRVLKYIRFKRRLEAMGVPLRAGPE